MSFPTTSQSAFLRAAATLLGPLLPTVSKGLRMAIWGDTTDQTFNPSATSDAYPMSVTSVEEFIRERVAEASASPRRLT